MKQAASSALRVLHAGLFLGQVVSEFQDKTSNP
jgi:hypothetical protein